MDRLSELVGKCKGEVIVSFNEHTSNYETVAERIGIWEQHEGYEIEPHIKDKMIELDTIVTVHFYPSTPIGFYKVIHYDLGMALDEALDCIK
jgi:hypothetical protein